MKEWSDLKCWRNRYRYTCRRHHVLESLTKVLQVVGWYEHSVEQPCKVVSSFVQSSDNQAQIIYFHSRWLRDTSLPEQTRKPSSRLSQASTSVRARTHLVSSWSSPASGHCGPDLSFSRRNRHHHHHHLFVLNFIKIFLIMEINALSKK